MERIWYAGAWRTPEGVERRKQRDKKRFSCRKKPTRSEMPHERAERERKRCREAYYKRSKELNKLRGERRKRNKDHTLRLQRERYHREGEREREKIYRNRLKRNPTIGLDRIIKQLKKGEIELHEVVRRYCSALEGLGIADGRDQEG